MQAKTRSRTPELRRFTRCRRGLLDLLPCSANSGPFKADQEDTDCGRLKREFASQRVWFRGADTISVSNSMSLFAAAITVKDAVLISQGLHLLRRLLAIPDKRLKARPS